MSDTEKYQSAFFRKLYADNPRGRKAIRGYKLVLKYREPNPDYLPKPEGADTRTAAQKRRWVWRQVAKTVEGIKTDKQATVAAEKWREEMNAQAARPDAGAISVPDYVDTFLTTWTVENSTMRGYKTAAKHIRAEFAATALEALDAKQVKAWLAKLQREGLSLSTQGKDYRLLNMVCKHAVMEGDLMANPCDAVKAPAHPKADPNALTAASREKLLGTLSGMEPTPLMVAANMALFMGLREGEICGLRWGDVDAKRGLISVCNAIGTGEGGTYEKTPKNDGSARVLAIPDPLRPVLEARAELMHKQTAQAGAALSGEQFAALYVIGEIDGRYKNPSKLGKEWAALASAFGLMGTKGRLCKFHDLRHTFATVAVTAGVDVKSIASFLGHSNAAMTLNIYASEDPDAIAAAAKAMGNALTAGAGNE